MKRTDKQVSYFCQVQTLTRILRVLSWSLHVVTSLCHSRDMSRSFSMDIIL